MPLTAFELAGSLPRAVEKSSGPSAGLASREVDGVRRMLPAPPLPDDDCDGTMGEEECQVVVFTYVGVATARDGTI